MRTKISCPVLNSGICLGRHSSNCQIKRLQPSRSLHVPNRILLNNGITAGKRRREPVRLPTSYKAQKAQSASAEPIIERPVALRVPDDVNLPEELTPLAEALEQAQQRVDQVTALREALEWKAQEVAQMAIKAKEACVSAGKLLEEAKDELKATEIVQGKLETELSELHKMIAECKSGEASAESLSLDSAITGTIDMKDLETELPTAPSRDVRMDLLGQDIANGDLGSVSSYLEDLLKQKTALHESVSLKTNQLANKVREYEAQDQEAAASAADAEDVASTAMKAAERAVREEMEAAAVTKETKKALEKAIVDLKDLGIGFAEEDDRAANERAKAVAENKKNAVEAVSQAMESDDIKSALAVVDTELRFPSEVTSDVPHATTAAAEVPQLKKGAASTGTTASSTGRGKATESMDDDMHWKPKKKAAQSALVKRSIQLACVVAVGVLYMQLVPGGLLSETSLGHAVQDVARSVSRFAASVTASLASLVDKLPLPEVPHGEEGLIETVWLLLTSVIAVPLVCKLPGGSPVLGFLAGGTLIGPHALGLIQDVEGVRHLAELGVVFLLFNIGLELSLERLRSMQKQVFGMGTSQVVTTLAAVAYVAMALTGAGGPAAVVLGGGLALSSTAVAMQVLQDRNETGSRHGRAAFAVLLLQDLAVVVLLMLIPLLAPAENGAQAAGFSKIAKALGLAAVKAISCIVGIILAGRTMLRPLYRRIADLDNASIFSATTLLVVLGTSMVTQFAGLSLALGAFLAGLLLAETEFVMQVESDIAPFKDLLMGLFFMTVGMEISVGLFVGKFREVIGALALLVIGKVALMTAVGHAFGLSRLQAARAGLLLAAGGEFAFVALILQTETVSFLFVVVALSMALTPFLAEFGQRLGKKFERGDMKTLQPSEKETRELRDHVIIAGFGRVGQIIAQLLSERLIPFVALDVSAERVQVGKDADLPVYFGDAGSSAILHSIGAAHARCAVITLDTPGANYRTVWALHKHYPGVKIYVRAHDVSHGITLEKAGATAVVPETLEPSLQLASAVLSQLNMPSDEVAQAIQNFRKNHVSELQVLCRTSGSTLGYGFGTMDDDDEPVNFNASPPVTMTEAVA